MLRYRIRIIGNEWGIVLQGRKTTRVVERGFKTYRQAADRKDELVREQLEETEMIRECERKAGWYV